MTKSINRITRFNRSLRVLTVPGDAVYLTSERTTQTRLAGALVEQLAPLLVDGQHSRESIKQALAEADPARIDVALDRLRRSGYVVEVDPEVDPRVGGYWEASGVDGDDAVRRLSGADVRVLTAGDVDAAGFTEALTALGTGVTTDPEAPAGFTVVLTDDYLRPELAEWGTKFHAAGTPWLPVKPVGSMIWVGPVFEPGVTGCYECLRVRLSNKNVLASYLRQRGVLDSPALVNSVTGTGVTRDLAHRLAALHVGKWLTGAFAAGRAAMPAPPGGVAAQYGTPWQSEVITLDTVSLTQEHHPFQRRPQCPLCGEPDLQADRMAAPVRLEPRPRMASSDGGYRSSPPEQFVARYEHLISPVTGPISNLVKVPLEVEGLHTYTAGQNFAIPMANANDLRAGLRSCSAGKGMSDAQAKASAVGEAIERYSGLFHGDEARRTARLADLDPAEVVHPNALHLYSDDQFRDRKEWNSRPSHFHWVADDLDPQAEIEWSPVWSLTEQRTKLFPTSGLYFAYHNPKTPFQAGANSNGCAAGTSLEDAILQGFMELVERDTVAMWWYHRLRRPAIDLSTFDVPYFAQWQQRYDELERDTWVLDLTNDLGIPSVAAVSVRRDKPAQDILFALGAHFDVEVAIGRALSEMNQFLPAVIGMKADGSGSYAYNDPDQLHWWRNATVENQPYVLPAEGALRTRADFERYESADVREDVLRAERAVAERGMEMLVLDQTRVDIGLPVVRVLVPGMRHFWPRFAPGRLFDVPRELGWIDETPSEADLNPIAMFL
ncbi:TOMM precursor leader peptide-binding protein [Amycolatopsis sp. NPDC050768]|uniref:TOMM precursor leader peptide-binding protein n=1 Tax=Amycolatopsis sp. NPDC050768 TaxID=3154839 RepID=UPI0033CEE36D